MRHRLYYLLPDMASARRVLDDMLLNRVEVRYLHFISHREELGPDLPEASFLYKTDVVHGAQAGMLVGAVLGVVLAAAAASYFSPESPAPLAILITLVCTLFGAWSASMVAAALPNSRLKAFYPDLERGRILLIADVPARRVADIEKTMAERHPDIRFGGEAPEVPVFP
ncbi:hypothetical protein SAMN06265795_10369 [Noviherbaspirillum humi]|uniref:DUF1269 domain-containing protein n=1 Tax=Noviherbaspirillum humi TaxID=1688639 RepID=A0A239EXN7_9BURK|nr:DUF1269 domain-containing protein [Noviherbaspirillum humi]SNS49375.1 hypothetical protein SAMN06265795_10369 [Noviherbaspirillum humi]